MIIVLPAGKDDCTVLAALHAQCFVRAWSARDFADLLEGSGTFALLANQNGSHVGFVLARVAADEAEILSLGVCEPMRRLGIGARLLSEAGRRVGAAGAKKLFLEVGSQNAPAQALYRNLGFREVGRRPGYYLEGPEDGVTMAAGLPLIGLGKASKVD